MKAKVFNFVRMVVEAMNSWQTSRYQQLSVLKNIPKSYNIPNEVKENVLVVIAN